MGRLPRGVSGQQVGKVLEKLGFVLHSQKGSHMQYKRKDPAAWATVPNKKSIPPGTLLNILHDADLTVDEFTDLLK